MTFPKKELEAIWAPWRFEYFAADKSRDFLSEAAHTTNDAAHLVVARRKNTFLMMNRFPYAVGHMMAVPYRKVADLGALTAEESLELFEMAALAQKLLSEVVKAQGFNIGLNIGKCAGAGVADHLHLHIVPRWEADSNFMPVLAGTRVLPESLEAVYSKLRSVIERTGRA